MVASFRRLGVDVRRGSELPQTCREEHRVRHRRTQATSLRPAASPFSPLPPLHDANPRAARQPAFTEQRALPLLPRLSGLDLQSPRARRCRRAIRLELRRRYVRRSHPRQRARSCRGGAVREPLARQRARPSLRPRGRQDVRGRDRQGSDAIRSRSGPSTAPTARWCRTRSRPTWTRRTRIRARSGTTPTRSCSTSSTSTTGSRSARA